MKSQPYIYVVVAMVRADNQQMIMVPETPNPKEPPLRILFVTLNRTKRPAWGRITSYRIV
ncbi:hypothetical protein SAMN06295998_11085 [Primorskyibacter flagellatus]|uniref:Uncharacterized protein n=1 Tax=Primorskyibacter flagellatus TaxID=1387277 RepID=A0A1W2D335_9RHOB|nr:hypothetical protein SAMN06295998_11085 [Primorskyibacter flagellatus]